MLYYGKFSKYDILYFDSIEKRKFRYLKNSLIKTAYTKTFDTVFVVSEAVKVKLI